MATKSRAEIEASYIMAKKFPRNEEDARVKVIKTCKIPSFAEKAKYAKPIGGSKIIGPSIRLAEEMMRQWGHIDEETSILWEDDLRRIVQVRVIDLESGATKRAQFLIEKSVERKKADGRIVISERLNSYNEKVHVVVATEDEVFVKQNAMASKFRRNLILQLIPTYILEDALAQVDETVKSDAKANIDTERRKVCDNFAKLNIIPSDLEKYLGHPVLQMNPEEIADLKTIFTSIAEGHTTWKEVMDSRDKVIDAKIETGVISPDQEPREEDFQSPSEFETAHNDWAMRQQKPAATFKPGDPSTHQEVENGAKGGKK